MTTSLVRLTDGTITKNFSTGDGIALIHYTPKVVTDFTDPIEDEITIEFRDTPTNNLANLAVINRLIEQARNYDFAIEGNRVYLEVDFRSTGTYYRALVLDGRPEFQDALVEWQISSKALRVVLHITRVPYWEGQLTTVPLTNSSASNNVTGIDISNQNDSSHENFVDVQAADVLGDLPASIKLDIENTLNGSARNKEYFVWHNVNSFPSTFEHMLEGEDGVGVTPVVDANCQNGNKVTLSWSTTNETKIISWAITDTQASRANGGRFVALARWKGVFPYTNMFLRLRILSSNNKILWEGKSNLVADDARTVIGELTRLDTFQLPPSLVGLASLKGMTLALYGFRDTAGTHTLNLDYLQMSPVSSGKGWKRFISADDGVGYQEHFVHDDTENFTYRVDTSGKIIGEYSSLGSPILLTPNKDQRLYFNMCDKDGLAPIAQTLKIKLSYRSRRSSL